MIVEKQMECRLAGETEVLRENLPQYHFSPSQNPTRPGFEPGPPRWEVVKTRLRQKSKLNKDQTKLH
jgi:hypothetical protein